jgi:hypothetical protein
MAFDAARLFRPRLITFRDVPFASRAGIVD